jgi:GNAT superfamily N-acetyltransferase
MAGSNTFPFRIIEVTPDNYPDFLVHMSRHRAESGIDGFHFMPFAPEEPEGPIGVHVDKLVAPLSEPGWERGFVALESASKAMVGHVCLKSSKLRTALHRCDLGLGVELAWRGRGLGERLMQTAIEFVRQQNLHWIQLSTFSHNLPAQALYRKLGFREIGFVRDCFRIGEQSIDDVLMALSLR